LLGRIVFYTMPGGNNPGELRPAIIVRRWPRELVTLAVFTDLINDNAGGPVLIVQSSQGHAPGQYCLTDGGEPPTVHEPAAQTSAGDEAEAGAAIKRPEPAADQTAIPARAAERMTTP
jgi:hypothetical protein